MISRTQHRIDERLIVLLYHVMSWKINCLPVVITDTDSGLNIDSHNTIVNRAAFQNNPPHRHGTISLTPRALESGAPGTNLDLAPTWLPQEYCQSNSYAEGCISSFKIMTDCLSISITGSQHKLSPLRKRRKEAESARIHG